MTGWSASATGLWLLLSVASVWVWIPAGRHPRPVLARTATLIVVVVTEVVLTTTVALLAGLGRPVVAPWSWVAVALGGLAALVTGGAVTFSVLALADTTSRTGTARVQRTVLRGGAWIGGLERLAMFATLVSGWPEGMVAIVAVKAFARYPELKTGQATGAIERFIIGTFTSLGWAAACAGVAKVLT
jgi:F0F1-type ATP synthase membrane subunit c/vacuolar-type H+-ATPase subunit K